MSSEKHQHDLLAAIFWATRLLVYVIAQATGSGVARQKVWLAQCDEEWAEFRARRGYD